MGRHVNADSEPDTTAIDPDGAAPSPTARHSAPTGDSAAGHPLEDDAVISPDTHVGVDFDVVAPGTPDAAPSPAHPDALIQHGLVGDGHEME